MPQQLGPVSLQPNDSERYAENLSSRMYTEGVFRQELKPLPRLPRGWSRVSHETGLFLRTIGLGIIVTSLQGLFTKRFLEPEKAAVRQSRVTALLRALIHALPLGVALFEIVLNWKGHYVGAQFNKQNYLQFVAKAHEILMQASLATIILSYTRYQISAGNGMPFGAVLGALQFLQVSYLWSIEFWSAIMSKGFQARKKIVFSVLILICITVAATAGPSSANLLIPRQELWPEESSYLAVNATFQDIWPDRLDDDEHVLSDCKVVRPTTDEYLRSCPLSSLYSFLMAGPISEAINVSPGTSAVRASLQSPGSVKLKSSELVISGCLGSSPYQVCATAAQQEFLDGLITDTMNQNEKDDQKVALSGYHFIKKDYYQPYTVASCVDDTVRDNLDQAPLRFARISQTESEYNEYREIVSVPGLTKSQSIDSISGDSSRFRLGWVDLPQEIFNTGVPGAIVVHPQSSSTSSYNITTCTLNAGWGSSEIMTTALHQELVKSSMTQVPPWLSLLSPDIEDPYGILSLTIPAFVNLTSISYPQRYVSISKSWIEFLNPTIISADNSTTDVISIFLSQASTQTDEWSIALVFGFLLTTALSSTGANHETRGICKRKLKMFDCFCC